MPNLSVSLSHIKLPKATSGAFITYEDFTSLYDWFRAVTPTSLLFKVWFDVTYYFMISESDVSEMLDMRRDSFVMHVDQHKRRYVTLKNQHLFNGLAELSGHGQMELRMYEMPGSPRCPVASLVTYVRHLHPTVIQVWQRPREECRPLEPDVWYDMFSLGLTRLSRMMSQLSRLAGLSVVYRTCHVHNTALRHLELAGISRDLLRELRGGHDLKASRAEQVTCRPDVERCDATLTCRRRAQAARKRRAAEMFAWQYS